MDNLNNDGLSSFIASLLNAVWELLQKLPRPKSASDYAGKNCRHLPTLCVGRVRSFSPYDNY
jgi:hypothetical protein